MRIDICKRRADILKNRFTYYAQKMEMVGVIDMQRVKEFAATLIEVYERYKTAKKNGATHVNGVRHLLNRAKADLELIYSEYIRNEKKAIKRLLSLGIFKN